MNDQPDLIGIMLALVFCAVLLMVGQQYLETHPQPVAAAASPPHR
jgi:hypothetical protein